MEDDIIIPRICAAIKNLYGERLDKLVLFGSRARGDADADSDYDFAVFLKGDFDADLEQQRLMPLVGAFMSLENNYSSVQPIPFPADEYLVQRLPNYAQYP